MTARFVPVDISSELTSAFQRTNIGVPVTYYTTQDPYEDDNLEGYNSYIGGRSSTARFTMDSAMLNGFSAPMPPSDAELATQTLNEEASCRFASFDANDAVTLGLSLRKRFRASSRHAKGKGLVISIQTIAGHTLFACTVGDLGGLTGMGDVSLDSWACLEVSMKTRENDSARRERSTC